MSVLSFTREVHHQVHGSLLLNCMAAEVAQGFSSIALASLISARVRLKPTTMIHSLNCMVSVLPVAVGLGPPIFLILHMMD